MEPLITLLSVTLVLLLLGVFGVRALRRVPTALRGGLSAMFVLTGVSHFTGMRAEMIAMVPDVLPAPDLLVTLTGIAELAGALGLLVPRLHVLAASGLTVLLIAVLPANVALALSGDSLPWYDQLLWRMLAQMVFLAATITVAIDGYRARRSSRGLPRAIAPEPATRVPSGTVS